MALIEARDLRVERGGRCLAHVPALAVDARTPLVILGPSGAGKTTLVRALLGLLPRDGGTVTLDGAALERLVPRERAAWFAWLPQLAAPQEPLPVVEYLLGARFRFDEPRARAHAVLRASLATCGVEGLAAAPVSRLSGGELQRVQLAGLIAQEARFLVLDEPANHLDPALTSWLHRLLADRVRSGQGLVAVTHDLGLVTALERQLGRPVQLVGLAGGRERFSCASDDPVLRAHLEALYGIGWEIVERGHGRSLLPADP